ncbi:MAG TPA: hypothetical protein VFJ50_05390 [Gemmatimonadales bacterium]|nr:hypothetical protein [Gemmatimonadales bacterium]
MRRVLAGSLASYLLGAAAVGGAAGQTAPRHEVQVQMRNVSFHVDSTIVIAIHAARGELRRADPAHAPYLDDKHSFVLDLDTARIGISPAALGMVLNRYTFAYPGSPLRKLEITIEGGRLRQHGRLHGISFDVLGELSLTPDGELRLHPTTIKAVGIKVGGLMKFFGLRLEKLVDTDRARGVRIEKDDFLLSPTRLLPSPSVDGRLGAVEVANDEIVLLFHPPSGRASRPLTLPVKAENYMFFRGGVLRFGKLTMDETDLLIVDADQHDVFDFWLDRYNDQLVAGSSRNTRDHGLIVQMPDFAKVIGEP